MNIVLLILDALRYDYVNEEVTPNLMKIAEKGVFFTNAFACNSSTIASMPCILCAQTEYNPQHNIATVLQENNLQTAMIHSNPMIHRFYEGFQETIDLKSKNLTINKSWKKTLRKNLPPQIIAGMKKLRASLYEDDKYLPYSRAHDILEYSLNWMRDHDNYFLWSHLMEPHIPYYPLKTSLKIDKHQMRTLNDKIIESVHGNYSPTKDEVEQAKTLYQEDIGEMDFEIGIFMESFSNDDLLIITADHGEEFGEHNQFSHHENKLIPELTHVPLIVYGGGSKQGTVVDDYVSSLSITPTILDSLGIRESIGTGNSIWNLIKS